MVKNKVLIRNRWVMFLMSIVALFASFITYFLGMETESDIYFFVALVSLMTFFIICAIDKYEIFEVKNG